MIRAIMFDLYGTLVQSEKMKALSYAVAVQRILGLSEPDQRAIEVYREIVGASGGIRRMAAAIPSGTSFLDIAELLGPGQRVVAIGRVEQSVGRYRVAC